MSPFLVAPEQLQSLIYLLLGTDGEAKLEAFVHGGKTGGKNQKDSSKEPSLKGRPTLKDTRQAGALLGWSH